MLMKDQAAVAQLPGPWTPKWSLSSRDKKRLKQILALCAAIVGLLWLLFQLGQYTVMGAGQPSHIRADGDRKMTVPATPLVHHKTIPGASKGKSIAGIVPPVAGVRRPPPADGAGTNRTAPTPLAGDDSQSGSSGAAGTGMQQQFSSGSNSNSPVLFGYGYPPMPLITGGGPGNGPNTSSPGGNGGPGNNPNILGGNGGPGGSPGGNNPDGNGPGNPGSGPSSGPGGSPGGNNPNGNGPDNPGSGPSGGPGGSPGGNDPNGNGPDNPGSGPSGGPGSGPGDNPFPDLDNPPPFGTGGPDNGGPSDTPITDSTPGNGPAVVTPTVDVPEPNSLAMFAGGLAVLLFALRRRKRLQASWLIAASIGAASLATIADPASAETATVYGRTASIFSPNSGAFLPANTDLTCFSMNEANCWDGKKWLRLYPAGRRHYAVAATDRIACSVIVAPSNDCWTGSAWYRLPRGQLFGVIGGFFSDTPGAFITAPLRTPAVTYTITSLQSPLGQFATKR